MNWRGDNNEGKKQPLPILTIAFIAIAVWISVILIIWEG